MKREFKKDFLAELKSKCEPTFLEEAGRSGYVCPNCGNGSKTSGTGIVRVNGNTEVFWCHKCGLTTDIFGLYELHMGRKDFVEAVHAIEKFFREQGGGSFSDEDKISQFSSLRPKAPQNSSPQRQKSSPQKRERSPEEIAHIKKNIEEGMKHLGEIEPVKYLKLRGISVDIAKSCGVGFVKNWRLYSPDKEKFIPATPRLIFPNSKFTGYTARYIGETPIKKDYLKLKQGESGFFNAKALLQNTPVFITEGEMDCLSFLSVGVNAFSLGSVHKAKSFVERTIPYLETVKTTSLQFVVALDNDDAGRNAAKTLCNFFEEKRIWFRTFLYSSSKIKDPNEELLASREGFINLIRATFEDADIKSA